MTLEFKSLILLINSIFKTIRVSRIRKSIPAAGFQKGIWVDALGAFNVVPQIGISMVNPDWDAVTVSRPDPEVVLSVGVRPPL